MQQAGAIIRVSTSKQLAGTSPTKQLTAIRDLAEEQGYRIDDKHAWLVAESGSRRERAGFRLALDAADAEAISRVYVFSVDRLGRNLLEMLLFLRDLDDLDADVWEAEKRRRLIWDDFILQVEGAVASKERQEIVKRTQDGLKRAIKAGKYCGGIIAYGYRLNQETKKLEIDEEEAAIVRLIFDWCAEERLSCRQIAERLNGLEIPTRYKRDGRKILRRGKRAPEHTAGIWRAGRIRHMLRNSAYVGQWEYGKRSKKRRPGDRIKGFSPRLISDATFRKADRVLKSNRWESKRPGRRQYLLRGLIKCGHCGMTYLGSPSRVASGEKRYYRCPASHNWRKLGKEKCQSKSVIAKVLEDLVWNDIKAFIKRPEHALEQLRAQQRPVDETLGERLAEVRAQTAELERRERNLLRVAAESTKVNVQALDEVLTEVRDSLVSLTAYQNHLQERISRSESLEQELSDVAKRLARLRDQIDQASFNERRQAVEELVKGIEVFTEPVHGQKTAIVTITYRFDDPEVIALDAGETFSGVNAYTPAHADISEIR